MGEAISGGGAGQAHSGNLQAGPTATRPTYRLIQILRAIAALMVVAHHATLMLHDRNGLPVHNWNHGSAGVDIFFVISGFVMMVSSAPLRKSARPAVTFLARRLERVVPLYWIATTLKVITLLMAPALALNALGSPWHVIGSYLFLPALNPFARYEPVIVVGWTLNFEMLFYVLFAITLATRASLLKVLTPVLLFIAALSLFPEPAGWTVLRVYESPMLLEFLAGMWLAYALPRVKAIPAPLAGVLVIAGFATLFFCEPSLTVPWARPVWSIPAAMIVCGTLALETKFSSKLPRWCLELGDASYSIYLFHGFALPAIGLLLARFGDHWPGVVPISLVVIVVFSTAVGELVYRLIERPITGWFKGRRRTAIPVNA